MAHIEEQVEEGLVRDNQEGVTDLELAPQEEHFLYYKKSDPIKSHRQTIVSKSVITIFS